MAGTNSYLTVTLDLSEPIEISDFAAFFAGLASQFDDYLAERHPDLKGTAKLYVREVRSGSIVADLVPMIDDVIGLMDNAVIILSFTALFSKRVRTWISGQFVPTANKSDLKYMGQTIRAVAHDKDGTLRLESMVYKEGLWSKELEVKFNTKEARAAEATIEAQKKALDKTEHVDHERVLMRFRRSDIADAEVGKRSGELVVIEEIQAKPLPLMYGSQLAEERLKDEIRDHDSVYYKGFVVDVNVQSSNGRNVAYSVTNVHQVLDLSDSDVGSSEGGKAGE